MGKLDSQSDKLRMEISGWQIHFSHGYFSISNRKCPHTLISKATVSAYYSHNAGKRVMADFTVGTINYSENTVHDIHGQGKQLNFFSNVHSNGIKLVYTINFYEARPFVLMRLTVINNSLNDVYLHDINLLQANAKTGGSAIFEDKYSYLDFFKIGWHDWVYSGLRHGNQRDIDSLLILKPFIGKMLYDPGLPVGRGKGDFWSEGWGILTDQKSAILAGFVSTANQFGVLHVNCRKGNADMALSAPADGVLIEAGEQFLSDWGYLQFISLPSYDPASDYVEATARQMNARVPIKPPHAQWTHWYHYFQAITADLFIANLNTIDTIRQTIPFKVVQLDDGYQSAWGDWTICNNKFPSGLRNLSEKISLRGYIPGLWLAPFVVDPRSKLAKQHPEWMVKDRKGKPIISGYFYDFYGWALDLTHPDVIEHIRSLLHTVAREWGFGFIKTDFVYAGGLPGIRKNPKITRAQAFRKGMEAIREGIGNDTFLLGCGCPFGPAIGIVDAMRIGPDTAPNWTPYLWSVKWATPIIRNEKSIGSLRNNIRHTLNLSTLHRKWWWNDPDCLMVRNYDTKLNDDEVKSNLTLIGLSGGLMINSDDLTRLSKERQQWISFLTPLMGNGGFPLDLLQNEMPGHYVMTVNNKWAAWHNTAVFNWDDRPSDRIIELSQLGYKQEEKLCVFDFWEREYIITTNKTLKLNNLPAHGCRLLRICRLDAKPVLVGDTLHITQGCEIVKWSATHNSLEIKTIDMERYVEGSLWISIPGKIVSATANAEPVIYTHPSEDIYRFELKFHGMAAVKIHWE